MGRKTKKQNKKLCGGFHPPVGFLAPPEGGKRPQSTLRSPWRHWRRMRRGGGHNWCSAASIFEASLLQNVWFSIGGFHLFAFLEAAAPPHFSTTDSGAQPRHSWGWRRRWLRPLLLLRMCRVRCGLRDGHNTGCGGRLQSIRSSPSSTTLTRGGVLAHLCTKYKESCSSGFYFVIFQDDFTLSYLVPHQFVESNKSGWKLGCVFACKWILARFTHSVNANGLLSRPKQEVNPKI